MTVLLDKWAIYKHPLVNWKPHNGQLVVAQSSARHQVLSAGRRFGKSVCGGYRLLPEIFFTKPIANQLVMDGKKRIFWIVGPAYEDSEKEFRVIWNLCKRLEIPMDQPGSYNNPENGAMRISLFGGAMLIIAKSAQNPERLVGEGLSGVILSEAAKLKESVWLKYLRPTLADFGGWSFWSSTPESKNHFYHAWRRGQDPNNSEWESWRMPAWINQYVYTETGRMMARTGKYGLTIPKEEFTDSSQVMKLLALQEYSSDSIHKLAKEHGITGVDTEVLDSLEELTPEAFKQEIVADFTTMVGRVFKEFDEETHVTDLAFNPKWETYGAVDYGVTNPNVWLLIQVSPWGEINVLDEVYEEGLDSEEFADEIRWRQLNPFNLRYFYPDPAGPGDSKILSRKLGITPRGGTGGEITTRVTLIRKALRIPRITTDDDVTFEAGGTRPQLLFDRKCVRTIADMLAYRYPEKKQEAETSTKRYDNPLKKDDHGPEALGRFFIGHFVNNQGGMRIHQAEFGTKNQRRQEDRKPERYMRPVSDEQRRVDFPVINDALGNYLAGSYDR